jgi:hypothetical protein
MRDNLQCKLWPHQTASDIGVSIYQIFRILRYVDHACNNVLKSVTFGGTSQYRPCYHRFQLFDHALPILSGIPTPVLETHREYMKMVNAEIGILD